MQKKKNRDPTQFGLENFWVNADEKFSLKADDNRTF